LIFYFILHQDKRWRESEKVSFVTKYEDRGENHVSISIHFMYHFPATGCTWYGLRKFFAYLRADFSRLGSGRYRRLDNKHEEKLNAY